MIIGAIGGDFHSACATELGRTIARSGLILLTGGDGSDPTQVKDAAMCGAANAGPGVSGRRIAVLPCTALPQRTRKDETEFLLYTGKPHNVRNYINGLTPDALVAFGGSCGTLAETAFALAAGRPIRFYGTSKKGATIARLRKNLATLARAENLDLYLTKPLEVWQDSIDGEQWNATELFSLLSDHLCRAEPWVGSVENLIGSLLSELGDRETPLQTGFPGLPGIGISKEQFEQAVTDLSK
jgi:hypothetical protein